MLERHFNANNKKYEEYLLVCERLGKEPDPNKIPMDMGNYPYEVQMAFLLFDLLPDRWDGAAGVYLGKDWSCVGTLIETHKLKEELEAVIFFLKALDNINMNILNTNLEAERKKADKKSQGEMNFPKGN